MSYEYVTAEVQWRAVSGKQDEHGLGFYQEPLLFGYHAEPKLTVLGTFPTKEAAEAWLRKQGWSFKNWYWRNGTSDYDTIASVHCHEERNQSNWQGTV